MYNTYEGGKNMKSYVKKGTYTIIRSFMKGGEITLFTNDDFNELFENYFSFLKKDLYKDNTIEQLLYSVYLLLLHFDSVNFKIEQLNIKSILSYTHNFSSKKWTASYKTRQISNIRRFLNWCHKQNYLNISGDMVFPYLKWNKRNTIISFYTDEEIQKLLNSYDTHSSIGKEQFLLISLIVFLGLRVSDAVFLKLSNIDFQNDRIVFNQFKTKKLLELPLIDQVKYPLIDYLKNVRPKDSNLDYIFITTSKPYRHKEELRFHYHIVSSHLKKSGIDITNRKHGFHSLRHSFSTRMLLNNTPIYSISTMLGHTSVEVTNQYLDIDTKFLKELSLEVPIYE